MPRARAQASSTPLLPVRMCSVWTLCSVLPFKEVPQWGEGLDRSQEEAWGSSSLILASSLPPSLPAIQTPWVATTNSAGARLGTIDPDRAPAHPYVRFWGGCVGCNSKAVPPLEPRSRIILRAQLVLRPATANFGSAQVRANSVKRMDEYNLRSKPSPTTSPFLERMHFEFVHSALLHSSASVPGPPHAHTPTHAEPEARGRGAA